MVTSTFPNEPRELLRWRRRRAQRGAAVFVIVLVITMLSALGVWAARSATLVDVATGHNRQALQVQYLADMGMQSATAFMANGLANEFVRLAERGTERCTQTYNPHADGGPTGFLRSPFCYPFFAQHLNRTFERPLLIMGDAISSVGDGSLGPHMPGEDGSLNLLGDFVVEMTDRGPAPPCRGCEVGGVNEAVQQASVVLTAIATIHPDGATNGTACTLAGAASSGRQMMRGHAIISPIYR